ncbi:phage tail tape measure protein [Companilactobacillus ginsenosidimutans]|uniref:phage tail tape measure protein n=1 Tax=Companilactobacillus ginsenosidimutans TaxID=1007676 RepID=UPI0006618114|nr:phage tail tape measure protein [Companilactobacillus ginsenosidimutans]
MAGSLGHLAATVTLNIDPFKQSSAALTSTIKNTNAALKTQDAAAKAYGNSLNGLKANYSTMQQQMRNYQARLKEQEATYARLSKQTASTSGEQEKLTRRQQNAAAQVNKTKANMMQLDAAMGKTNKQIALQENGFYKVGTRLTEVSGKMGRFSDKMGSIGNTMTTRVTAPIVAGFGYAAKSAIDFNSQIANIAPLLKANGESASQVKSEMTQMSDASKKWATEYGVSTDKINAGMTELVKRGYSANQTMGAMPSILNAAKASGDDFNDVMTVSTSTLEQFGLKSNSTAGMLKNTERVTDSLTYTANATAAGFTDMGDAMTYVGPTAHSAGISLEETAAAIGLMSNQGIEGSVAGTALRSALTRLMKPSRQNVQGFKELGINVEDFKNHSLTLPEILDKIKTNTQGWTKEQKASAVAMAFGTEAQAGMNALINEGGGALTDLTKKTKEASGSTKEIADTMNNTSASKIARFKESLHVLAITVGEKLTPTLMPLVKDLTNVVKKFAELDDSQQQTILKSVALVAAIGPVAKTMQGIGTISKVTTGSVGLLAKGIGNTMVAFNRTSSAGTKLLSMFSSGAEGATLFAGKTATAAKAATTVGSAAVEGASGAATLAGGMEGAAGAASGFALMSGPVALGIAGVVAAVAGGVWAWNSWGKQAWESSVETSKWGTTVGKKADTALTHMKDFNGQASQALKEFDDNASESASSIGKSFKGMSDQISQTADDANKKLTEGLKGLPDDVAEIVGKAAEKQKKNNEKIKKNAKQTSDNVNDIVKNAAKKHRGYTDDENQYILNSKKKMNDDEIKLLGISGKKKTEVEKALNSDVEKLTTIQAGQRVKTLQGAFKKEQSEYKKQSSMIKNLRKQGLISEKDYQKAMSKLSDEHSTSMDKQGKKYVELAKQAGHSVADIKATLKEYGISYDEVTKKSKKNADTISTSNSRIADTASKMSKVTKSAGEQWNKMVLDPKTGRIKTDAQKTINDTAKTGMGWAQLQFELKHAKITSNAKSMIGEAAIQSGRWNDLPWKEKETMIRVQGDEDLTKVVKHIDNWDKLTPKQQTAIVRAKGQKELSIAMINAGEWNDMSMKDKQALVNTSGEKDLVDLLTQTGTWNGLSMHAKEAVITGKGNAEVVDQLKNIGKWNDLTPNQKDLIINNKASRKIVDALIDAGQWDGLTLDEKNAVINDDATGKLIGAMVQAGVWQGLSLDDKDAIVNDKATAKLVQPLYQAGLWNGLDVKAHDAIIQDKASAPVVAAMVKAGTWDGLTLDEKDAIINTDNSAKDLGNLVGSYVSFNDMPEKQKNIIVNSDDAMAKFFDAGNTLTRWNMKKADRKKLVAENQDILDKTKNGEKAVVDYNGKKVIVKKLGGNDVELEGAVNDAKDAINRHNKKKANKKNLKGDAEDVKKKSKESTDAVQRHNDKKVDRKDYKGDASNNKQASKESQNATQRHNDKKEKDKYYKGHDKSSGPASSAIRAILRWNGQSPVVHSFVTVVSRIFRHAKGTNDSGEEIAMVNDERGSMFRELIKLPTGEQFIPQGRNIMVALPKHSQVVPARETSRMFSGIKQYANGTPGYSKVVNDFTTLNSGLTDYSNSTTNTNNSDNSKLVNNQNIKVNVTVNGSGGDGQQIGQQTADIIEQKFREMFNNQSTAFGGGSIA